MAVPLSDEIKALLDGPNFAHMATVMADGSPHVDPVWVGREGGRPDPNLAVMDAISRKYTGKEFSWRNPKAG